MLITHRRVDDAANGEGLHVAGEDVLAERLGIGAGDLKLPQRAEVHHHDGFAAGVIFLNRAGLGKAVRQPISVILDEVAGVAREAVVKAGLFYLL